MMWRLLWDGVGENVKIAFITDLRVQSTIGSTRRRTCKSIFGIVPASHPSVSASSLCRSNPVLLTASDDQFDKLFLLIIDINEILRPKQVLVYL